MSDFWYRAQRRCAEALRLDLRSGQQRYAQLLEAELPAEGRWLEIGCGRRIVPEWAATSEGQRAWAGGGRRLVGVDLDPSIRDHPLLADRAMASGDNLPFASGSFQLVTANMVFEHLARPGRVLSEIRRVLRPEGSLLIHTPNYRYLPILTASMLPDRLKKRVIWKLERREEEDVFPTYYRANTPPVIERLLREAGFRDFKIRIEGTVGALQLLGPIGVLELPFLKLVSLGPLKSFNAAILVSARKSG